MRLLRALLRGLACAWMGLSLPVQAQGYEVLPWPARQPVPALQATDLKGQVWRLADLRGKAVLINFWASWCEPCRAEMPSLQDLAQRHGPDRLLVLAVNFKEPALTAQRYVERADLRLPVLLDPEGALARQWGVKVFPSTILVAADGRVHGVVRGELDWSGAAAAQLVAPLLAPAGPQAGRPPKLRR
jgi:thiol-disulfide isomerase/thioredoxin